MVAESGSAEETGREEEETLHESKSWQREKTGDYLPGSARLYRDVGLNTSLLSCFGLNTRISM